VGTIDDASVFASVGEQSTFLHSKYNSFQATVEKSLSHGLSLRSAYTYAHALDNGSSFEAGNVIPSNFNLTYGTRVVTPGIVWQRSICIKSPTGASTICRAAS